MQTNSSRLVLPVLACVLAVGALGCGDDAGRPNPPGTGGSSGSGDGGGGNGGHRPDGAVVPDGGTGEAGGSITIEVLTPAANAVVAGTNFPVSARIIATGVPVDTASIIARIGGGDAVHLVASSANTYDGSISIQGLESGPSDLVVAAGTLDGGSAFAQVPLIVNAGPVITILRPAPNEPSVRQFSYDFTVHIAPELTGIQVGPVSATVGLCAVTLGAPTGSATDSEFTGTVDLDQCSPRPNEGPLQFAVVAHDTSTPAVSATKLVTFIIDRSGPVISVTEPAAGQLEAGFMNITAHVTDPSGVRPDSVFATISHSAFSATVQLTQSAADVYSGSFDTQRLPNPTVSQFPAVEVVAQDSLGNTSNSGGIVFTLDNVPPTGDLDPVRLQYFSCDPQTGCKCSEPYDPVGSDAVNDLQTVRGVFELRAEVRDGGNEGEWTPPERPFTLVAGVSRVTLRVLHDVSHPLVVDTNGDGICDQINPDVIPQTGTPPGPSQAVGIELIKMDGTAGTPDYVAPNPIFDATVCGAGAETRHPDPLCFTSTLTVSTRDYITTPPTPLIWTIGPVVNDNLMCEGLPFDSVANNIGEGWVCAAVYMEDGLGNHSVSRPIRLCVERNSSGSCASPGPPPDCTGTRLDNGTVTSTPCTARRFDRNCPHPDPMRGCFSTAINSYYQLMQAP
jgi:hypothetical protein